MKLNELSDKPGARSARKRVARGIGSGTGKTAGRGVKGQKSRSGVSLVGNEGGQMPLYRRLPKRGFTNIFAKRYVEVNLGRLQVAIDAGKLDPKKTIDAAALKEAGVIRRVHDGVRVLAKGELKAKVTIEVAGASKAAVAAIEEAGGTITIAAPAETAEKSAPKGKAKADGAKAVGKPKAAEKDQEKAAEKPKVKAKSEGDKPAE